MCEEAYWCDGKEEWDGKDWECSKAYEDKEAEAKTVEVIQCPVCGKKDIHCSICFEGFTKGEKFLCMHEHTRPNGHHHHIRCRKKRCSK